MKFLWYGIFYSFLGFLLEKGFAHASRSPHKKRRCFVALPLCPVYGIAMAAYFALGAEQLPSARERFLLGVVTATAVEYAVHWGYEKAFGVRFWDYRATKCDVNGRICLPFSLLWGVLAAAAARYVQPAAERLAAALPAEALAAALFCITFDGIFAAKILLATHDIDALTPFRRRYG